MIYARIVMLGTHMGEMKNLTLFCSISAFTSTRVLCLKVCTRSRLDDKDESLGSGAKDGDTYILVPM